MSRNKHKTKKNLLHQDMSLIYQDWLKTALVTLLVVGVLMAYTVFIK